MDKEKPSSGIVQLPGWKSHPGLRHGFTTRFGGVSQVYGADERNLGFTLEDDPAAVRGNRAALLHQLAAPTPGHPAPADREALPPELAMVRQVHSATVLRADRGFGQGLVPADGIITGSPGLFMAVLAADCVPVLVADPRHRAAGAFHAGWRGTAAEILRIGIGAMVREFGSRPEELLIAIGPSIGPCCYAVGGDVLARFPPDVLRERSGQNFLDLWQANRAQALQAGVLPANISVVAECTACTLDNGSRRYFSHRADAGRTGRGVGIVGWL